MAVLAPGAAMISDCVTGAGDDYVVFCGCSVSVGVGTVAWDGRSGDSGGSGDGRNTLLMVTLLTSTLLDLTVSRDDCSNGIPLWTLIINTLTCPLTCVGAGIQSSVGGGCSSIGMVTGGGFFRVGGSGARMRGLRHWLGNEVIGSKGRRDILPFRGEK